MHTIKRQNENEWYVGRIAVHSGQEHFVPMFHGMSAYNAAALCSMLNGGPEIGESMARILNHIAAK